MKWLLILFIETAMACEVKSIRYVYDSKTVVQKNTVCLSKNKANSENCQDMANAKCFASSWLKEKVPFKDLVQSVGSPGFNLCHKRGGLPQLYEIEMSPGKWMNYERCQSADLKEFIDIDDLIAKVTY